VDTETEIMIQEALEKLLVGRTSIVIAHRLSTIKNSDRIVVLHKGTIKEIGTHAELLEQGGIYHRLYQLQYKDQEIPAGVA
jgi:ATP-binding cassette subfamily B multidrug efflux pump